MGRAPTRAPAAWQLGRSQALGLAVDQDQNAVVAGTITGPNFWDVLVVRKFDPSGNVLWSQSYTGPNGARSGGATFVQDGSVLVGGTVFDTAENGGRTASC